MLQGMPIIGGPQQGRGRARGARRRQSCCAPRTTAMPKASAWCTQRTLMLSHDGQRLDGEDVFMRASGEMHCPPAATSSRSASTCIPSVKANRLTDPHGAMLMLPNKEVWTFTAYEDRIDLEESVYLAGTDGPRRTVQLVIYGRARKAARVQWTFAHMPPGTRRRPRRRPQLPLREPRHCRARGDHHDYPAVQERTVAGATCMTERPSPHYPRAPFRLRQDRAGRVRARARGARRRADLHRRHAQGAGRCRTCGARRVRGHRLSRDDGRAGQDAASARCTAACWRSATMRSTPPRWRRTASRRSISWWSTSIRSRRRSRKGADFDDLHREHRHRRARR